MKTASFYILTETQLVAQQHADPKLRLMIDYAEGRNVGGLRAFSATQPHSVGKSRCR